MTGNITRRGEHSWRLKYEAGEPDSATGKRKTRFVTVRGTKKEAQRELTRLLAEVDNGTAVDPSRATVAEYVRGWLDGADNLAGKTRERYRQLAEQQIIPHLGSITLQKLRPAQIADWHATLLKAGGKGGRPLSSRTVGHAHRVLHTALARAARLETVGRNVASVVRPPKVEAEEVEILSADQIRDVLIKMRDHPLFPVVAVALGTGMRRGELCAVRWGDIDLDALDGASVRVSRSIEETADGLREKAPKSRNGRRTISVPASAVDALRGHRAQLLAHRLLLGVGRLVTEDLVFPMPDGSIRSPDNLSRDWRRAVLALGLPPVMFHALRHAHASALIAAGLDVLTISRRLGHASAAFTLNTYTHLFVDKGDAAAQAMDAAMAAKA